MRKFFRAFRFADWITFLLSALLVGLTLLPVFSDVPTADGWLRSALISLAAAALAAIVLSQIAAREVDKDLLAEVKNLVTRFDSTLSPMSVHEVPAAQIGSELDRLLSSSKEWYFRGGSARWQRETVLPKLAEIRDRPVEYNIQIISPFESDLCEKYALYRRKSRPDDDRANSKQISYELLAFIYAAAVWAARSKISPRITLLHRFSPFRLDGNSDSLMITVADMSKNGLRTSFGNWYHSSLLDEFIFEAGNASPLSLPAEVFDGDSVSDLQNYFVKLVELNPSVTRGWQIPSREADLGLIFELSGVKNA